MSLYGDIAMFWRFATRLRPEIRGKTAKAAINETIEEIDSIARYTKNSALKRKCESLLSKQAQLAESDLSSEPFYEDIPAPALIEGYISDWCNQQRWPDPRGKRANAEK